MRDKDSHLIFESYKKRVLVNEVAALAVPATEGLGAVLSWVAGTAVGAVIVDQAMKMLEKIPEFKRKQIESKINETNKILELNPEEIRSSYEIINAIKSNGGKTFSKIADMFKEPVDIFRSAQDNGDITMDTYYAVLNTSINAYVELINLQDLIDREIDQVISKSDLADIERERIRAQRAKDKLEHKERLAELENERLKLELELKERKGGGGNNGGKGPKGGYVTAGINILGLILKVLRKNFSALKSIFWFTVVLVPGFGIFLIKLIFGSGKEYGKAAEEFASEFKKEAEKRTQPKPATPSYETKGGWVEDTYTPNVPTKTPAPEKPKAKPTPFPY